MRIQPISEKDLPVFASWSSKPELNNQLQRYILSHWDQGTSRPEWCFTAVEGEQIVGRVVYWASSAQRSPTDIDFFDVDWTQERYLQIGTALLNHSFTALNIAGNQRIKYQLNHPNALQPVTDQRLQILSALGFFLRRQGYRWETRNTFPREADPQLRYTVVHSEAFLQEIFQRTLTQSLDRGIQRDLTEFGQEEGARRRLKESRISHRLPDGWQIASLPEGEPVGIIMVGKNDGGPIIDYLGILPEHRGHGYVHGLLAQGVNILLMSGAKRIRSDCDVNNEPMIRAFQRAAFTMFCTRSVYVYPSSLPNETEI
ncbi:MAG TPA: GNAT family N-acetyltransferase [Ktedonobacteraceae bacterium]